MTLARCILADMRSFAQLKGSPMRSPLHWLDLIAHPGVVAVILFRVGSVLYQRRIRPLSRICYFLNVVLFGCELMPGALIGPGLTVPHPVGVGVATGVRIGRNARIMGLVRIGGGATEDPSQDGVPTIGDDCWLLDGAKVFGRVRVGDRTVIGADSLVLGDLPSDVVAVGRPARVIRQRDSTAAGPA